METVHRSRVVIPIPYIGRRKIRADRLVNLDRLARQQHSNTVTVETVGTVKEHIDHLEDLIDVLQKERSKAIDQWCEMAD